MEKQTNKNNKTNNNYKNPTTVKRTVQGRDFLELQIAGNWD